jgi:mannose-6-phosphate isomerase-like protein (cupin superfamily)
MTAVTVRDVAEVAPRESRQTGLTVRATLGPDTGFDALEQAVLTCPPGRSRHIDVGEVEETLFVLEGEGVIHIRAGSHRLEPGVGAYLPPGSRFELECTGQDGLRVLAVRIPDPSPGPPSPPQVSRLADREAEAATASREFRIVADPETGLRSATHFVGYIPTDRAPDHFHTYDEVIYVLEGRGVMHAGSLERPVAPGTCIQLPARTVHCLENTGADPMRIVAVFRPAGSPAAAFYPDGTPAYKAKQDTLQRRRDL